MRSKLLIGGLMSAVICMPALAQTTAPASKAPPAATTPAPATHVDTSSASSVTHADMWRSSKLIGVNVYNDQNEKLGDISEILLDKSGKVDGVVIGVGGFLGVGQHDIMVEMSKLKFVDEPVKTSSTTTTTRPAGTTGATSATTTTSSNSKKWYPDHAVLSGVTKDQLKAMPQFKYN